MGTITLGLKKKVYKISGIPEHDNKKVKESIVRDVINSVERTLKQNKKPMNSAKLDEMLEHSELSEKDCLRLGREVNERVWKKHKTGGW